VLLGAYIIFIGCAYIRGVRGWRDFGRYDLGGDSIAKKTVQTKIIDLDAIAESNDFEETIRTADLVGQKFVINSVKTVNGLHGESYVGEITIDGELREAWLSGKKLSQALDQITEADALPYGPVTITQGSEAYSPFVLRDA
jgi:hypothetical protein